MARTCLRILAAMCAMPAFAAACFLSPNGAPRAETLADSATAKAMLGEIVDYAAHLLAEADEDAKLEFTGEASAAPRGEKVELIFPAPRILLKDGSSIRLGDIIAAVTPKRKNEFEFSVDLPQSVFVQDADGRPALRIDWGESAMRGTWRADLETATVFHGALRDVIFTEQSQEEARMDGRIDSVILEQELTESAKGRWSGPFLLEMTNLKLRPAIREEFLSLEKLSLTSEVREFDLAAWRALSEVLSDSPAIAQGTDTFSLEDIQEAARIIESLNAGAGKMGFLIVRMRYGSYGMRQFALAELAVEMGYDNDARPGDYSLAMMWNGLEQSDSDVAPEFYPHAGALKLHLERFPMRQILSLLIRESAAITSAGEGEYGDAFQELILPLINSNRTGVRLEEFVLRSSAASLTASGSLTAEEASAVGVVGGAHIEISGLDKLIVEAARQAESGEEAPNLLAILTFIKGLGRPEIGAGGELAYVYDILLAPDGKVTINEIPLDLLRDSGLTWLPMPEAHTVRANTLPSTSFPNIAPGL